MNPNFIVVAYFTESEIYEHHANNLIASLKKFKIPCYVAKIKSQGSWYANTNYKPTFLKYVYHKYSPTPIVYVDVDAVFHQYPSLFDEYSQDNSVEFAVHKYKKEILSGTVYIKPTETTTRILNAWERACILNPKKWDQISLRSILGNAYTLLPGSYCKIFDIMPDIVNPVIVHHQASREYKKQERMKK